MSLLDRATSVSPSATQWLPRAGLTGLLLAITLGLAACGGAPGEAEGKKETTKDKDGKEIKEVKPVPVEVAAASRRSIAASYISTAALEAPNEAMIVAKTSGVLLQLNAEEGDQVRAGQTLAKIDPERARLEVARSEALLRKLEAEYARSEELFERKLIAADANERIRFDVATQRAAYNLARLELSYTDVVAPFDGVVAQRMVKEGNLININQTMFRVVDAARLEAVLNVPERELATLRVGLPVSLAVDALPGVVVEGKIDRISPVVDAATGTFRATATFTDEESRLKPGMFGRLAVTYEQRGDALTVPRLALVEEGDETAVFVVRAGAVVKTRIVLGYVNGEFAEVLSGIEEGDRVVTAGKVAVRDGTKIEVIGDPPVPAVADPVKPEGAELAGASEK
ncbi:MAG: efflux RND transporter periplasmic adaptor subunit [Pseudomarimonas sp.]